MRMYKKHLPIIIACAFLLALILYYFLMHSKEQHYVQQGVGRHHIDIMFEEQKLKKQELLHDLQRKDDALKADIDPPEIRNLKQLLNEFKSNNDKWDNLIAIGDIYRKGSYPRYKPNIYVAIECFKLAAICPNGNVAGMAQAKYVEARVDYIQDVDIAGKDLPVEYGHEACAFAKEYIRMTPYNAFQKPQFIKKDIIPQTEQIIYHGFIEDSSDDEDVVMDQQFVFQQPAYTRDLQNVHDHSIVSITKKTLDAFKDDIDNNNRNDDVFTEAYNTILMSDISDIEKSNAIKVLDSLNDKPHSSFGTSEKDALRKTWKKIETESDEDVRNNLKETLVKQLASAVEHGHVVCSTGKITRIVSTLDGVESLKSISTRPVWAIRDEISTLASKVRTDFLSKLTDEEKTSYNNGANTEIEERMKSHFKDTVLEEYCDHLGMSKKVIEPIIEMNLSGF